MGSLAEVWTGVHRRSQIPLGPRRCRAACRGWEASGPGTGDSPQGVNPGSHVIGRLAILKVTDAFAAQKDFRSWSLLRRRYAREGGVAYHRDPAPGVSCG